MDKSHIWVEKSVSTNDYCAVCYAMINSRIKSVQKMAIKEFPNVKFMLVGDAMIINTAATINDGCEVA